jgi:hypothetical protein
MQKNLECIFQCHNDAIRADFLFKVYQSNQCKKQDFLTTKTRRHQENLVLCALVVRFGCGLPALGNTDFIFSNLPENVKRFLQECHKNAQKAKIYLTR